MLASSTRGKHPGSNSAVVSQGRRHLVASLFYSLFVPTTAVLTVLTAEHASVVQTRLTDYSFNDAGLFNGRKNLPALLLTPAYRAVLLVPLSTKIHTPRTIAGPRKHYEPHKQVRSTRQEIF